jgi:hypothetical protein
VAWSRYVRRKLQVLFEFGRRRMPGFFNDNAKSFQVFFLQAWKDHNSAVQGVGGDQRLLLFYAAGDERFYLRILRFDR